MEALRRALKEAQLRALVPRDRYDQLFSVIETLALSVILNWSMTRHYVTSPRVQAAMDYQFRAAITALELLWPPKEDNGQE